MAEMYPASRGSAAEVSVIRSRTWSEAMTKGWDAPITACEGVEDAVERYCKYFLLTQIQLKSLYHSMLEEMRRGMKLHGDNPMQSHETHVCSLLMRDVCVAELPTGTEKGTTCVIEFAATDPQTARASKVTLEGHGRFSSKGCTNNLKEAAPFPKGALDANATATQLFDCLADAAKHLKDQEKLPVDKNKKKIPFALVSGVELDYKTRCSAVLRKWAKGFETGRNTDDSVEGMDIGALMDCAFRRNKVEAETTAVCTDAVGLLMAGCYSKLSPPCRAAVRLSSSVNGCFVMGGSDQEVYKYKGCVVDTGLSNFDVKLPINDIDLEIDFAHEESRGGHIYEKMIGAEHVAEICRRIVVKVWQNEAPELAWVRCSMPWQACVKIVIDNDVEMSTTGDILRILWDWETTVDQRKIVRRLFDAVFERSAALTAVSVAAISKMSDRLQPAMGGLTCAVDGILYTEVPFFDMKLRRYLNDILGEDLASLIHFHIIRDGHLGGAGVLVKCSA